MLFFTQWISHPPHGITITNNVTGSVSGAFGVRVTNSSNEPRPLEIGIEFQDGTRDYWIVTVRPNRSETKVYKNEGQLGLEVEYNLHGL